MTDNIIAMGYPTDGIEAAFRNPYEEVFDFLEKRHKGHYKVYNLCSERAYPANRFFNRVACYPFDDHCAPPLAMIGAFTRDAHAWIERDPRNVVVVHCKAGKGASPVAWGYTATHVSN